MKFTKIGNVIEGGISLLVYANPGIGKTTLASTLPPGPKDAPETLIINTEAGFGPLLGTGHTVLSINADNLQKMAELYQFLKTEKHTFKYVVLDNISMMEQWILAYYTSVKRKKEFPELREYGDTAVKLRQMLTEWRDLTCVGINVIFNAWEMVLDIKQDAGIVKTLTVPKMSKKFSIDFCGMVDIVAHLEKSPNTDKRWLRLTSDGECIAKTQYKGLDEAGEVADLPTLFEKLREYNYGEGKKK
jgi:phage nucleotide-binding protein